MQAVIPESLRKKHDLRELHLSKDVLKYFITGSGEIYNNYHEQVR
jgi:hypothetical protein